MQENYTVHSCFTLDVYFREMKRSNTQKPKTTDVVGRVSGGVAEGSDLLVIVEAKSLSQQQSSEMSKLQSYTISQLVQLETVTPFHVEHHPGQVVSETLFQHKVAVGMTHAQVRAEAGHPEGQHLDEVLKVTLGDVVGLTHAQVCAGAGHPVSGHHEGHLNSEVVGVRPAQACAGAGHV